MASLNDYSNNAKIKCPYFKMQHRTSIQCGGAYEGQNATYLVFGTEKAKTNHISCFCTNGCWKGCAIAIAITEREETEDAEQQADYNTQRTAHGRQTAYGKGNKAAHRD